MTTQGYRSISAALFRWTTYLCEALPTRSIPTFLELLFGALLTSTGFVTDAYLALSMHRHWGSYYKWLQTGRWSWLTLGLQLTRLVALAHPTPKALLVIDDTVVLRSSTKAPSVGLLWLRTPYPLVAALRRFTEGVHGSVTLVERCTTTPA
jgi:hypothetical protein